MTIWADVLTRNEDRYLWFSVVSIVDHVDKVLIWDDGSSDKSPEIILKLAAKYPNKIIHKLLKVGSSPENYPKLRQAMLESSDCQWVILVDADEVWWDDSIRNIINAIKSKGEKLDSIVTSYKNVIGDIYHYQSDDAGMYTIDGRKGHLTIRAMNKNIPGLSFDKPHGQLCLIDKHGVLIQNRDHKRRLDMGLGYLHFTNMIRSTSKSANLETPKRSFKFKYELGKVFPTDYYYPEAFFKDHPKFVMTPWKKMTKVYYLKSVIQTPLKRLRRKFVRKVGY